MAYCPECKAEMPSTAIVCPSCQYDFPTSGSAGTTTSAGFANSGIADVALMVGSVAAGFAAIFMGYMTIVMLIYGNWWGGLVTGPIAFFAMLGILVVFLRVQNQ